MYNPKTVLILRGIWGPEATNFGISYVIPLPLKSENLVWALTKVAVYTCTCILRLHVLLYHTTYFKLLVSRLINVRATFTTGGLKLETIGRQVVCVAAREPSFRVRLEHAEVEQQLVHLPCVCVCMCAI